MIDIDETSYLLNSPENGARLLKSIEDYKQGLGKERELIEGEDSNFEKLDSLTKEDYQRPFKVKAKNK
ncbi:MAG: hypothetical protein JST19_02360 [Bacteroidetes bacterium]|nr:hypothetical protein [Bacteroidota bacterium]